MQVDKIERSRPVLVPRGGIVTGRVLPDAWEVQPDGPRCPGVAGCRSSIRKLSGILSRMRIPWPRRWRSRHHTVVFAGEPDSVTDRLTALDSVNVTAAHRTLLETLVPVPDAPWSNRALWACLNCDCSYYLAGSVRAIWRVHSLWCSSLERHWRLSPAVTQSAEAEPAR